MCAFLWDTTAMANIYSTENFNFTMLSLNKEMLYLKIHFATTVQFL